MTTPHDFLEIRSTEDRGSGVFATQSIPAGTSLLSLTGAIAHHVDELPPDSRAVQIGPDSWLYSFGSELDDFMNHSCDPNAGFVRGDLVLYSLRPIEADEEVTWDYSTSISLSGWSMECLCPSPKCRKIIRPWPELSVPDRARLTKIAMNYLRVQSSRSA